MRIRQYFSLIVVLLIVVFFLFLRFSWDQSPKTDQLIGEPYLPRFFYLSENKIFKYEQENTSLIFDPALVYGDFEIHSILPSPDLKELSVLLKSGSIFFESERPGLDGKLKHLIIDQAGQVLDLKDFIPNKFLRAAFFWDNEDFFIRLNTIKDGKVTVTQMELTNENTEISANRYDQLVKTKSLNMIFTDFVSSAFRKTNQKLAGSRLYLDGRLINESKKDEIKPILSTSRFWDGDEFFNTFQVSPDEKNVVFDKDWGNCPQGDKLNEMYIYNFETDSQFRIANQASPINYFWANFDTLIFDSGYGANQKISLFLASKKNISNLAIPSSGSLYFVNSDEGCKL